MMVYTHWQHINIMYYAMYYIIYLHEDIYVLCNIYLYEDTMYYEICAYGDIRVLCNMVTCRHTCIM